tara:strand:- start:1111 stop:1923 length:813 start_codon:yes stop_codon:yes gene_type:complete
MTNKSIPKEFLDFYYPYVNSKPEPVNSVICSWSKFYNIYNSDFKEIRKPARLFIYKKIISFTAYVSGIILARLMFLYGPSIGFFVPDTWLFWSLAIGIGSCVLAILKFKDIFYWFKGEHKIDSIILTLENMKIERINTPPNQINPIFVHNVDNAKSINDWYSRKPEGIQFEEISKILYDRPLPKIIQRRPARFSFDQIRCFYNVYHMSLFEKIYKRDSGYLPTPIDRVAWWEFLPESTDTLDHLQCLLEIDRIREEKYRYIPTKNINYKN